MFDEFKIEKLIVESYDREWSCIFLSIILVLIKWDIIMKLRGFKAKLIKFKF